MDGPVGVKVRDPRKGMRFFTYRTLPMGFSWSPYLAEAAALFCTARKVRKCFLRPTKTRRTLYPVELVLVRTSIAN